jgi:uncharacterized spore protein YtfJ
MEHAGIAEALSKLEALRDVLTVKRVFGEAYEAHGVTVIPVAAVLGGGGGGGGQDLEQQVGTGAGLGVIARPVGVFVVDDQGVRWKPAVDITRIVLGTQLVAVAAILLLRRLAGDRRR